MKSIKISDKVHKELKIFAAKQDEKVGINEFVDAAIVLALQNQGHKFEVLGKSAKKK